MGQDFLFDIRQTKPDIRPDIKKGRISGRPDIRCNPNGYVGDVF